MKIILSTGGTAGHIFPAFYTAEEFRKTGHQVVFVGVFKTHRDRLDAQGYASIELPAVGISFKNVPAFLRSIGAMIRALGRAWSILKKERPAAVLGFGAYGAFAVMLAAVLQGYPTLIHEQNVRPGKANKLLSLFVRKIAVTFSESCRFFPKQRTVITGCPCRPIRVGFRREELAENFSLYPNTFTILVSGGSQGSHGINVKFLDALALLPVASKIQVIHACGAEDYEMLRGRYRATGVAFYLTPFLQEMDRAYAFAHLAICRAGAGTVTELAGFGVPAILIPYPHAGGHQQDNAAVLVKTGVATMIEEKDLSPQRLRDEILKFYTEAQNPEQIRRQAGGVFHADAAQRLVRETLALVK